MRTLVLVLLYWALAQVAIAWWWAGHQRKRRLAHARMLRALRGNL